MMKCCYCHKHIVDDSIFCSYCGRDITHEKLFRENYAIVQNIFAKVAPNELNLNCYFDVKRKKTMNEIFKVFCVSLQNYNMMPSVIKFTFDKEHETKFKKVLYNYNVHDVVKNYDESSLYNRFCNNFFIDPENKNKLWHRYAKGIICIAKYLSKYRNSNDFYSHLDIKNNWYDKAYEIVDNVNGLGFAMACDVLKNLGYADFAKPDKNLIKFVSKMGLKHDYENVVKTIQNMALVNNDTAYNIDRKIWLICTGDYFLDRIKKPRYKKELFAKIKSLQ